MSPRTRALFVVLSLVALAPSAACSGKTSDAGTPSDGGTPTDGSPGVDGHVASDGATLLPVSGGAFFQLGTPTTGSGPCPDASTAVSLSAKAADGTDKLLTDGVDGASVQCAFDTAGFSVSVANKDGFGLVASGSFDVAGGALASHAKVKLVLPGKAYASASAGCSITMTQKADGVLVGRFLCAEVDAASGAACGVTAVDPMGAPFSFFKFANCR